MSEEKKKLDLSQLKDTDPIIGYEQEEEAELVELNSTWDNIVNTFKKSPLAIIGLVIIAFLVITAIFAPVMTKWDPYTNDLSMSLSKPGVDGHLLGTDCFGRDLLTRLFRGTRISLLIAFITVFINVFIGVVYGAISAYYGGWTDIILTHLAEVLDGLPYVVITILFMLIFGSGMFSIILALCVTGWIGTSRLIRAQFYRFKGREYVLAARTLGVKDRTLIFRHILPTCVGPLITRAMIAIPGAIFSESFLAYIGLGIKAPEPSIGILLSDGQSVLLQYPYQTIFPAVLISVLMIAFNLFANGLRDALDPSKRGEA